MTGEVLSLEVLDTFVHLARLHGVDTTLETLQRRYAFPEEGLEASALVALAADLMLDTRWATMKWSQLSKLENVLPAMLMLRDGSAIILESLTNEHGAGLIAHVSDIQASGAATAAIDAGQMATIWDGRILLCKASTAAAAADKRFDLRWLATQVLREQAILRDIAISSIFTTLFALGPPFLVMIIIDRVLINHSSATLAAISIIILSLVIFETILYYFKHLFMEIIGTRIDGRLELFVMERLLRLPMNYFETTPVGFTASRIAQIYKIRSFLTGPLLNTMLDSIALVLLVPVLFILNWRLSFFVVALALMILGIIIVFIPEMHRRHSMVIATDRLKMTYLIETIQGMRAVKSLALEGRRRRGWDERVANSVTALYSFGTLSNWPQTLSIPFQRMMYSGSLIVGAAMALSSTNTTDAGSLIAFAMIAGRTGSPLVELAHLIEKYYEVRASVSEVGHVVNVPPEDARGQNGLRLPIRGNIIFDSVRFRYSPETPLALDDASFEIRAGTIFGIMGRSGSGKTTVTRLLQGLNKTYEGSIKIDGMDLREIDLHHLRTSIGVVPQENFLFTGTVRENIGMAKASATFAQIVRAAQLAGAEEFIEKMPRGYDTLLQEGATNLSGGQRQRLALARALLIEPSVLILDEATSALDAESEAIINANLVRIAEDRTIICVSHRLAMLVPADAILVMEQGKAYDIGRHEELLHRCDIYKLMWHQQNRHLETSTNVRSVVTAS